MKSQDIRRPQSSSGGFGGPARRLKGPGLKFDNVRVARHGSVHPGALGLRPIR